MSIDTQVPLLIKDVILMSPGKWNGWNYSPEELNKAYSSTNWADEHITSLFLDHPANPHNAASAWIGRVKNPKQLTDSTIKGDLEVWDEDVIFKLTKAKAGFGVSPRVVGKEDKENKMFINFIFDNFSIVAKPAQSTAVLHLANELKFEGIVRNLNKDSIEELNYSSDEECICSLIEKAKNNQKMNTYDLAMLEKMHNYMKEQKIKEEEIESNSPNYSGKLKGGKNMSEISEIITDIKSEELSDAEVLSIINEDFEGFNNYSKELKATNPSISLKDLAKKYKSQKERFAFVETLSELEATALLKRIAGKIGVQQLSLKEEKADNSAKELSNEIATLRNQIKELSSIKNASPKSVKGVNAKSASTVNFMINNTSDSEGVLELAQSLGLK